MGSSITITLRVVIGSLALLSCSNNGIDGSGSLKSPRTLLDLSPESDVSFADANGNDAFYLESDEYRLPTSLKPIYYEVWLQPFLHGNFSIVGHVCIHMEVLESTSTVYLHINDIVTFDETLKIVSSDDVGSSSIGINDTSIDKIHDFYIISLEESLEQGKRYNLTLDFEAYLNTDDSGFYLSSYVDQEGNTVNVALTQFEATNARRAFPCFDEPALKARFEFYLGREESVSSLSNMPLAETIPIEDQAGWYWDHFETSVPMSSYLVAFVISDYVSNNSMTIGGTPFAVWARSEMIKHTHLALTKGPEVITFYEEYLDVPYTLPKMDMVASVGFGGAMENWGLIIFSEESMLFDPEMQTEAEKQHVTRIIAHETSHQWFGDLVTMGWWSHLWLNEGFAKYMEYLGADYTEPSWNIKDQFVINELQKALEYDSVDNTSHPLIKNVSSPAEIVTIIDPITYEKGASLNRMMNHILTEATFVGGLNTYLLKYQYDNAFQDDLFEHLTTSGHEDETLPADMTMKEVMDTWTLQAGYPVITVNRSDDGRTASISQKRFWDSHEETDETWWVPLTYTSQDHPDFESTQPMVWMSDSETEVTVGSLPSQDQWVIFNIQETGFYRVNYDENNWDLLRQQLETEPEAIHPLNRAQILDDYSHLAHAGYLSYASAMDLFSYLHKETSYLPWASALQNLDYIESMFLRTDGYYNFKNYLLHLITPLYNTMELNLFKSMPQQEHFKQIIASYWACTLGHRSCVKNAQSLFARWMQNPEDNSVISPNLKQTVYCTSIAFGDEEEWNFAWSRYLRSEINTEKRRLLDGLACSKDINLLQRYLEMAFTRHIGMKREETLQVFTSVAKNPAGGKLAWEFLRNNVHRIIDHFGSLNPFGEMVEAVSETFNTDEELSQLLEFHKDVTQVLGEHSSYVISQAIQKVKNNIEWMQSNYDVIVHWLEDHGYGF